MKIKGSVKDMLRHLQRGWLHCARDEAHRRAVPCTSSQKDGHKIQSELVALGRVDFSWLFRFLVFQ